MAKHGKKLTFRFNTRRLGQDQGRENERARRRKQKKIAAYKKWIADIPLVLSGKKRKIRASHRRVYDAFWGAVTLSLFTDIHQAYKDKSEGGPDLLGNRWPDILPKTKAYHRPRRGLLTPNQRRKLAADTPGLLSPSQYAKWRKTFAKTYWRQTNYGKSTDDPRISEEAKIVAGKVAWSEAKALGAETLIEVLGSQDMLLMRVTDTLFNSLRPGKVGRLGKYRKGDRNQVVHLKGGELVIGTKVPYAGAAEGKGGKRRLWPKKLGIWYDVAIEAGRDAMGEAIEDIGVDI